MSLPLPGQGSAYQRAAGRYSDDAVNTANPARLLVLLYDRLELDLNRARQAQLDGDRQVAHDNLVHAQDIVTELLSSLDLKVWDGAAQLARLYTFLLSEMARANMTMDAERTAGCLRVVQPLREAWTEAASATRAATPSPFVGMTG